MANLERCFIALHLFGIVLVAGASQVISPFQGILRVL